MRGLVLAAGEGTRLRPLTNEKPKVMVEVGGKPLVEHIIDGLRSAGIEEISIVKGYMGEVLEERLADCSNLSFVEQEEQLGTAHAIGKSSFEEPFVVVNGDVFMDDGNIEKLVKSYERGVEAVIGSREVEDPRDFGVLEVDGKEVTGIQEKPDEPPSNLVNTGLYVFTPKIYRYIEKTGLSERNEYEITDSLKMMLDDGLKVLHTRLDGHWIDVGRHEDLERARKLVGETNV